MKDFVQYLVENIAKHPEDVSVVEKQLDETYIKEEITVNPDDMGLIIGREGRTIRSIRELAKAKAIKERVKVDVELLEPEGGRRSRKEKVAEKAEVEKVAEVEKETNDVVDETEAEVNEMAEELMGDVEEPVVETEETEEEKEEEEEK